MSVMLRRVCWLSHRRKLHDLVQVAVEVTGLGHLLPGSGHTFLKDEQAIVQSTLSALNEHTWVLFASQHPHDPSLTAVGLYDKPLTLADLMNTVRTSGSGNVGGGIQGCSGDYAANA